MVYLPYSLPSVGRESSGWRREEGKEGRVTIARGRKRSWDVRVERGRILADREGQWVDGWVGG